MVPSLTTLRRQRDFARLFREGRRQRGRLLTLVYAAGPEPALLRCATIASRKVGGAVVRNRVRRRLREILRRLPWREGLAADVAVIAHPTVAGARFASLQEELTRAALAAGLLEVTGE